MQRITLPGADLQTSRLGFGTASLHHALRSRERQAVLGAALDAGFTHFDTARMYGEGLAERELGRFLGKTHWRRHGGDLSQPETAKTGPSGRPAGSRG